MDTHIADTSGVLDEALERLHASGPEREGWPANHAPMVVESLVRNGRQQTVHRWIDRYRHKLEARPAPVSPVTPSNWRAAVGDARRLTDWAHHFTREVDDRPWRDVLTEWWPRLLPGISGAATHPVIRTGHAVRTLLAGDESAPRRAELAHGLAYWAARHHVLTGISRLPSDGGARDPRAALDEVPLSGDQSGGALERFARIGALPVRPGPVPTGAEDARAALAELVRAATHRYGTHGYAEPVMLVHAATAPSAVLRILPALPRELWVPSLEAAWSASAAVTAVYSPAEAAPAPRPPSRSITADEVFAQAAAHGGDHTVKFADTALDAAGAPSDPGHGTALAAALRAVELNEPLFPVP